MRNKQEENAVEGSRRTGYGRVIAEDGHVAMPDNDDQGPTTADRMA